MSLVQHGGRLPLAALLALAAGATGCDPSPTFPAPTQPLVGRVVFEREVTMGTEPIELRTYAATLDIDPGTVPVGTKLLVRILDGVVKELTGETAGDVWSFDGVAGGAVQILSDATTFARPILLTVEGFPVGEGLADVLHADEGAAAWTRVGKVTTPTPPSVFQFTAELTGPHLWSLAIPPVTALAAPNGVYRLDRLICGTNDVGATPDETLEIDRGRYVWTRGPAGGACAVVERGLISIELSVASATFEPDVGDAYFFNIYVVDNDTFELKTIFARPFECAADVTTVLSFVPAASGADAGAPNPGSDGGCASDAGGSDEGGSHDAQGG